MSAGSLFVSFWHIGLDNIPEGTFVHRRVAPDHAKAMIEQARPADTLSCASHHDLFAPYHDDERRKHEQLCGVLAGRYGIALTLEDS